MKSILLIGMGKFGRTLGEKLLSVGDEVMIVDKNEELVNMLAAKYTNALIMNCTNIDNLKTIDIPSFDACVVAIGDDFQSSLEITSLLSDLGAKRIISKATTEIQRKFLYRMGASEVIYPDRDIAERLAVKLNAANVVNYIDLDEQNSIFELAVPKKWIGQKVVDVNPRGKYGMNILTVKKGDAVNADVDGDYVFAEGDIVVVFGGTGRLLSFATKK